MSLPRHHYPASINGQTAKGTQGNKNRLPAQSRFLADQFHRGVGNTVLVRVKRNIEEYGKGSPFEEMQFLPETNTDLRIDCLAGVAPQSPLPPVEYGYHS